ncbi:MAG TPA: AAA family ATPase [Ktedonobacterales bacterium]
MASKHGDLDKSIDRSLDDFGRWFRRKWWLAIIIIVVLWYIALYVVPLIFQALQNPGSLVGFILYAAFIIGMVIFQFVAIFWFLGRPRIYWVMPGETGVGFEDYKGNPEVLDAARRIVILLRGVKNFKEMGGQVSRGVLLVGPPGTGKSYLAQCIATESGVPFAHASAASFRAMFVGMDVLMIKNLYRKARRLAREYGGCILFLDEFDAIGMSRGSSNGGMGMGMGAGGFFGGGGTGGLNELLMQMDPPPLDSSWWKKTMRALGLMRGRHQAQPVLTIGATNIPDSLDAALLRPGRFDRKIVVAPPSDRYRGEVIEYYLAKVKHEEISLEKLVSDMQGYTPVAIKYVINEAAVIAHFDGRDKINYRDIGEAREAHEHGIRYPRTLSYMEKRRLAYHEAGHAIAAAKLYSRMRVAHATISKRLGIGGAEAFVESKPLEEIVTQSAEEIYNDIQVSLASRASEEIFLDTQLNGVGGDLHSATSLALYYVTAWGMDGQFFSASATLDPETIYTDSDVREKVEALLQRAYRDVYALVDRNRAATEAIAEALIQREDLDSDEIAELIRNAERPSYAEIAAAAISNAASAPYAIAAPVGAQNGNGNGNGHQRVVEGEVVRPVTGSDVGDAENVQQPDAG